MLRGRRKKIYCRLRCCLCREAKALDIANLRHATSLARQCSKQAGTSSQHRFSTNSATTHTCCQACCSQQTTAVCAWMVHQTEQKNLIEARHMLCQQQQFREGPLCGSRQKTTVAHQWCWVSILACLVRSMMGMLSGSVLDKCMYAGGCMHASGWVHASQDRWIACSIPMPVIRGRQEGSNMHQFMP